MKFLPPLIFKESYYAPIEKTINRIFEEVIFGPLFAALAEAGIEIRNAQPLGLERAITSGLVYFEDGRLYGHFNASISKELRGIGAIFDRRSASWKLPEGNALPARIQLAVAHAEAKADKAIASVIKTLDGIRVGENVDVEELKEQYGTGAWRMNEDFVKATLAIAIAPEFTQAQRDIIAREWAENLELYIKKWSDEAILDLRQKVQANTLRGQRSANLVKMIQETYGTSKTKAKFLARQETSLLMSKMREERYKDLGCTRYKWVGMDDQRERPDHRMLNNTVQSWDFPPITNRETGARNHPGEDFNCRCLALAILE